MDGVLPRHVRARVERRGARLQPAVRVDGVLGGRVVDLVVRGRAAILPGVVQPEPVPDLVHEGAAVALQRAAREGVPLDEDACDNISLNFRLEQSTTTDNVPSSMVSFLESQGKDEKPRRSGTTEKPVPRTYQHLQLQGRNWAEARTDGVDVDVEHAAGVQRGNHPGANVAHLLARVQEPVLVLRARRVHQRERQRRELAPLRVEEGDLGGDLVVSAAGSGLLWNRRAAADALQISAVIGLVCVDDVEVDIQVCGGVSTVGGGSARYKTTLVE